MKASMQILNPLPEALAHYCRSLEETITQAGFTPLERATVPSIEGQTRWGKLFVAVRMLMARSRGVQAQGNLFVVWPVFGYLDIVSWYFLARKMRIYLVFHDVTPLRKQFGYDRYSRLLARLVVKHSPNLRLIAHTTIAARTLSETLQREVLTLPHPISRQVGNRPFNGRQPDGSNSTKVRVAGQFKEARSIDELRLIARHGASIRTDWQLEICGRGWPQIEGWKVFDQFFPENEFAETINSADCIVIPYSHFYQSGIAIRALESGTPIVARPHQQLIDLYGEAWPGFVADEDWTAAIDRVLVVPPEHLQALLIHAAEKAQSRWGGWLSCER